MQAEYTFVNKFQGLFIVRWWDSAVTISVSVSLFSFIPKMTYKTPTLQNVAWFILKSTLGQACTWQFLCFAEDYFGGQSGREQLKTEAICIHTDVYSWASISLPDLRKTWWNTALAAEPVRLFELITVACSVMWFAWKPICFVWKSKIPKWHQL